MRAATVLTLRPRLLAVALAAGAAARAAGTRGAGWNARGYDCSGSVSYVLHAAGLLDFPLDSRGSHGRAFWGPAAACRQQG